MKTDLEFRIQKITNGFVLYHNRYGSISVDFCDPIEKCFDLIKQDAKEEMWF